LSRRGIVMGTCPGVAEEHSRLGVWPRAYGASSAMGAGPYNPCTAWRVVTMRTLIGDGVSCLERFGLLVLPLRDFVFATSVLRSWRLLRLGFMEGDPCKAPLHCRVGGLACFGCGVREVVLVDSLSCGGSLVAHGVLLALLLDVGGIRAIYFLESGCRRFRALSCTL
jgi:hypothetical protein